MSNKRIKVVHIAQANGGVEVYLKMFFKYFNSKEYKNYAILSQQYISSKKEFEKLGVEVFIIDMYREISPINDMKSIVKIYSILNKIKPNIVYSHSSKAGGLGRIPAKLVGAKNIYNPHGWAFDMNISNIKKKIYIYAEKLLSYLTDEIVSISKYEKDVAIKYKISNKNNINVIENAIDLEEFNKKYDTKNVLNEIKFHKDDIIIGMIARISEQKSPITFVNIAEKISKKNKKCKFIMVGDGDQKEEIENIIKEKKLESQFFITGWVDDPYKYLSIFNIALLTSKWEGFGLVIPEYMAARKPVIASNVGGITNIIVDGMNGFLIDNLDVDKFVEKIITIIENDEIRSKVIETAYNTVITKYDFKRVIKQHINIFETI